MQARLFAGYEAESITEERARALENPHRPGQRRQTSGLLTRVQAVTSGQRVRRHGHLIRTAMQMWQTCSDKLTRLCTRAAQLGDFTLGTMSYISRLVESVAWEVWKRNTTNDCESNCQLTTAA